MPMIKLLIEKAAKKKPGESGVIALNWFNGNRSTLVDSELSGMFLGMTLTTAPEDLMRALIEATAFGWRPPSAGATSSRPLKIAACP